MQIKAIIRCYAQHFETSSSSQNRSFVYKNSCISKFIGVIFWRKSSYATPETLEKISTRFEVGNKNLVSMKPLSCSVFLNVRRFINSATDLAGSSNPVSVGIIFYLSITTAASSSLSSSSCYFSWMLTIANSNFGE